MSLVTAPEKYPAALAFKIQKIANSPPKSPFQQQMRLIYNLCIILSCTHKILTVPQDLDADAEFRAPNLAHAWVIDVHIPE